MNCNHTAYDKKQHTKIVKRLQVKPHTSNSRPHYGLFTTKLDNHKSHNTSKPDI